FLIETGRRPRRQEERRAGRDRPSGVKEKIADERPPEEHFDIRIAGDHREVLRNSFDGFADRAELFAEFFFLCGGDGRLIFLRLGCWRRGGRRRHWRNDWMRLVARRIDRDRWIGFGQHGQLNLCRLIFNRGQRRDNNRRRGFRQRRLLGETVG